MEKRKKVNNLKKNPSSVELEMSLYIFTYATDETKCVYLLETARQHQVKIHCNEVSSLSWSGYEDKIVYMREELKKLMASGFKEEPIVCFIDAYDVLVNAGEEEIISRFLSYDGRILLGGERNCYPLRYKERMDQIEDGPSGVERMYVNSGGYMGYLSDVLEMLTWTCRSLEVEGVSKEMLQWLSDVRMRDICREGGDQSYLMEYYCREWGSGKVKIDIDSRVFQNMHLEQMEMLEVCSSCSSMPAIVAQVGQVYRRDTKGVPCFLHMNGGSWKMGDKNWLEWWVDEKKGARKRK